MSSGFRVSIPSGVRRTIQNIKEIAGNHSDDEVYAMLRECGMDPNETTQKLLLQDTFHEVKRKRDKRKETSTQNYREPGDSRWRSGMLGRGGRGGRGSYSSRYAPNDAGGGRDVSAGKEIGVNQGTDKGNSSSSPTTQAMGNKFPLSTSSSEAGITIGPTNVDYQTSEMCTTQVSGASGIASTEESSASETKKADSTSVFSVDVKGGSASGQSAPTNQFASDVAPTSVSRVYAPTSDPVLVPSFDELIPGAVGAIQREVGSQQTVVETITCKVETSVNKGTCQAVPSSPLTGSTGSRPSSNNSNRPQQLNGPHKVGPSKEWKPKSTSVNPAQPSGILGTSDVVSITAEALDRSLPSSSSVASDVTTLKLEDLQLLETQHVVIPHHLQVPESERHGLTFGSFDASFKLSSGFANSPASEDSSTPSSELSQVIQENVEEPSSSIHNESPTAHEVGSPDHSQTPAHIPDAEVDVSSGISAVPEHQSKAESSLAPEGLESSVVHTAPTYSTFGLVPQILGSQFAPFGSTEAQPSEATRLPSFVVQQPFDPSTSYYTQIYRPSADSDGRFSPFLAPSAATKYNGNVPVLPGQTGQSPQESGNFLVLSSAGPTPTQPAGIMQNSISVAQQPVPVFRQHGGVHISHYPPNYIPYNQYYSPFYVPPPTLHHFLSNAAFPQQPPTGSIYPPPAAASAAAAGPVKYPISPYKPGTNTVNSNQFGMPTVYGTYNSSPTGYSPSPAVTGGNSTGNEDLTASQYKENNLYITGQQSEGSAVWIPGRDISSLQVNPFYNLPPQGQHMTFAPTQAGHGALAGVYHPTQTVPAAAVHPLLQQSQTMTGAGEVAGPPAGVYQHPQQRSQINWGNNY